MSSRRAERRSRLPVLLRARHVRYGTLLVGGLLVVWLPALSYVLYAPDSYRSGWSILIPGAGVGSTLNLDSVGQASTSVASPYASQSVDPKVNYKAIVLSTTVLDAAARRIGTDRAGFGKPRIKLVDQTAIMQVELESDTADGAFARAGALHDSFEAELDRLRADERRRKRSGNLEQLNAYRTQVAEAQKRLLEYQMTSRTVSPAQLGSRLDGIERLLERREALSLQIVSGEARREALAASSGVDPAASADIVKLQRDRVLRDLLGSHSAVNAEYIVESAVLGDNNPKVRAAASRVDASRRAIARRAERILGFVDADLVDRFLPAHGDGADTVHDVLVELDATLAAARGERTRVERLIAEREARVAGDAASSAKLEELERGYRVSETIFLSALAKLDLGKSDIFASYPMTQVLVEPARPERPEKLARLFAIMGATLGSLLICLALAILWKRDSLLLKLQRNG